MNITELDNYRLGDAVKFHDRLNPRLWDESEHLRPDVKNKLLEIAADFREFLGIPDLDVKDITVSGSNAAYNYTPNSDIDLHLVVDLPEADRSEVFRELFDAKKYQYNDMHNIKIGGYDVELYVQDPKQQHHSQGIYSVLNDAWISVPKRRQPDIDDVSVRSKAEDLAARIDAAVASKDHSRIADLQKKIKHMRQSGLDQQGEYGSDNLAFKVLRNQGYIKKLIDARNAARDAELSLQERKKKKKKKVRYGFGGYWYPGFAFGSEGDAGGGDGGGGGESIAEVGSTPDGVSPSTKMFLSETDQDAVLKQFIEFAQKKLGIKKLPRVVIHHDADWSENNRSFGRYEPESHELHVSMANRHLLDILRTTAHELAHCRQNQTQDLPIDAGETGSRWENQANAQAGVLMRQWAEQHPEHFQDLNESSGYIPTAAEKNDPRFVMALSPDVRPGATGKNANKMRLKTDSQGRPSLLIKNLQNQLREFKEKLDRPTATPAQLAAKHQVSVGKIKSQLAKGIQVELEHTSSKSLAREIALDHLAEFPDYYDRLAQAERINENQELFEIRMSTANLRQLAAQTGALAGMEFEMIVPDVGIEDSEPEYERDDDQDRRARSFDDIESFFYDGDYNGRGDIRRLREALDEQYQEWKMDRTADDWSSEGIDYLRDYIENNDLFDRDEAVDQARDEFIDANPDIPADSEEAQQGISTRVNELLEQFVQDEFDAQGRIYNDAFTEFADEKNQDYDESDFLEEVYPYMSDVESEFDITWPYYYDANEGRGGEADVNQVADEFSSYMNKPVNASSSYHGARREPGTYVVEPDGSLEGDDVGDTGLEFVSPPMPIDEMLNDLNKVKEWAGKIGAYTNDSTGLHINISVPDYSLDKLDYVKLALLMGDEYVLELFGRSSNTYTKAATGKIRDALRKNPDLAPQIMDKMRGHMEDLATKAVHSGKTDKYTSINTKTGYIEFRSPGGDWLDANFDKIENTLLRFTVALSAAIDPQAYRQEYLKKLYKLLESNQSKEDVDVLQLFANYSAGELDKAALIRQVRQKQLARNLAKGKIPLGQKYWWRVTNPANASASIEVVATSKEQAIKTAVEPGNYPEWAGVQNTLRATPLRPYKEPEAPPAQTGNWGIWITSANRFARAPGQTDDSVLRRFPGRDSALQWIEQARRENPRMRTDIEVREIEPSVQNTGSTTSGNWGVWVPSLDRYATIGNAGPRRFENRAAAEAWIQDYNQRHAGSDLELQAREIEPQQGSGAYTYRVFTTDNNQTVGTFQSSGIHGSTDARIAFRQYLQSIGRDDTAGFDYQEIGRVRSTTPTATGPGSQADMERRLDLPDQTGDANYEIIDRRTGRRVFVMIANTEYDARRKYADWLSAAGYPIETEDYGFREIRSTQQPEFVDTTTQSSRGDLTPRGPGPWEIYRISDNSAVRPLSNTSRPEAEQEARNALGLRGEAPELYGVRTRQQAAPTSNTGSLGSFTGEWKIVDPQGREIHRFGGIGNIQADANRVAIQWLQRNPRHMQAGVEVLPVMG